MLYLDDSPIGRLPLPGPIWVPAGSHRFSLDIKRHKYASDILLIPDGRVIELGLTRGTKGTAIAVLTLMPMVLLVTRGNGLDASLRQAVLRAAQEGARAEHAVLVPPERIAEQESRRPPCPTGSECQRGLALAVDARMVLALDIPPLTAAESTPGHAAPAASQRCGLRGEILDVDTGQQAAVAEATPACLRGDDQVLEALVRLVRTLVSAAGHRGKGTLTVTSTPEGASVTIDGRPRGLTPWTGPSLSGPRQVVVEKEGYALFQTTVEVPAAQTLSLPVDLLPKAAVAAPAPPPVPAHAGPPPVAVPTAAERPRRPRWRLITGGALLAGGLLVGAFGASALSQNNACADNPPRETGNCNEIYSTLGVGGGLLGTGLAVATGGAILLAWPPASRSAQSGGSR